MRRVLGVLEHRTREFDAHPFYEFLRDGSVPPRQRLAFAPALAHFVMTFADVYRSVLREEPAKDRFQELVNAHTREDGGHWKWFLADLAKLDLDPPTSFTDALRFLWSDATEKTRMLSYRICRLGLGADSLRRLVLVQCIEATGTVTLRNIVPVATELAQSTGLNLVYFGAHHASSEADHTMEKEDAKGLLAGVAVDARASQDLVLLVDESFAAFNAAAGEMLAFARSRRPS
jgi:hypothetical protein